MVDSGSKWSGSRIHEYGPLFAYALLSIYSVSAFTFCLKEHWVPGWDGALYLLTARSIAQGLGYSYLGNPFFLRPPGLSWLLSFFVRDGGFDFHLLNVVIMAFAVATVWVVFFVFRPRYGCWWALALALLVGTSRLFVSHFNSIMADLPSFMLLYLGLGLLDRAARDRLRNWIPMVAGSLLLAGSAYMRTAALAAAPGIIIVYFLRQRGWGRLRGVIPFLIFVALVAPWLHHASKEASKADRPSEQLLVFDYKTAVFRVDPGHPDSRPLSVSMWRARIKDNAALLIQGGTSWILGTQNRWVSYALAVVVLLGFMLSLRRNTSMLDWFALVYVGLLPGYFVFAKRLLLPVIPLAFVYIPESLRFALRRIGPRFSETAVLRMAGAIAAVCLLALNLIAVPLWCDGPPSERARGKGTLDQVRDDQVLVADWLRLNTAQDAAVLAGPAPILSLLADRAVYTYRFRPVGYVLERHDVDFAVYAWWAPRWGEREVISRARSKWVLASSLPGESIRIYHLSGAGLLPEAPQGEPLTGSSSAEP